MSRRRFAFRPLTEADLPLLHEWLQRPHVRQWWPSPATIEGLREEYLPAEPVGAAHPFLALRGNAPTGYIQYYVAAEGSDDWWPDDPGPGVLGIDQFLADGARLGQGLGTSMVRDFTALLFRDPAITQIRVDPRPDNVRAIRCYLKAGFREIGPITTPDGAALFMVLERPADAQRDETASERTDSLPTHCDADDPG